MLSARIIFNFIGRTDRYTPAVLTSKLFKRLCETLLFHVWKSDYCVELARNDFTKPFSQPHVPYCTYGHLNPLARASIVLLPCRTPALPSSANAHTSHAYMAAHSDDASSDRREGAMGNSDWPSWQHHMRAIFVESQTWPRLVCGCPLATG